jgi:hypothetical protein
MSQSIFPVLRYRDARGAIAFLRDTLGFEPTAVHPPEGEDVAHAELAFAGQHLMLGSEPAAGAEDRLQGPLAPYLAVDDVDGHFERARRRRRRRLPAARHRLRLAGVRHPRPRGSGVERRELPAVGRGLIARGVPAQQPPARTALVLRDALAPPLRERHAVGDVALDVEEGGGGHGPKPALPAPS